MTSSVQTISKSRTRKPSGVIDNETGQDLSPIFLCLLKGFHLSLNHYRSFSNLQNRMLFCYSASKLIVLKSQLDLVSWDTRRSFGTVCVLVGSRAVRSHIVASDRALAQ